MNSNFSVFFGFRAARKKARSENFRDPCTHIVRLCVNMSVIGVKAREKEENDFSLFNAGNHLSLEKATSLVQFSSGPPTFFVAFCQGFLRFFATTCVSPDVFFRDAEKNVCLPPRIDLILLAHLNKK